MNIMCVTACIGIKKLSNPTGSKIERRGFPLAYVNDQNNRGKSTLERIARRVMTERGFLVDFSEAALNELEKDCAVRLGGEILP